MNTFQRTVLTLYMPEKHPRQDREYCVLPLLQFFLYIGLTEPTDSCAPGYYCPQGSSYAKAVVCPIGKQCPLGSAEPQDCVAGTYTDSEGQAACQVCPEGWYRSHARTSSC